MPSRKASALDDHLDVILVLSPRIVVAPPHWPLVLADEAEMLARGAHGRTLIALLSPQSAGVAAFTNEFKC